MTRRLPSSELLESFPRGRHRYPISILNRFLGHDTLGRHSDSNNTERFTHGIANNPPSPRAPLRRSLCNGPLFVSERVGQRTHSSPRLDSALPLPQGAQATAAAGNQNFPRHRAAGRTVAILGARNRAGAWLARRSKSRVTWTEARARTHIAQEDRNAGIPRPTSVAGIDGGKSSLDAHVGPSGATHHGSSDKVDASVLAHYDLLNRLESTPHVPANLRRLSALVALWRQLVGERSHERWSGRVKARGRRASSRPGVKEARPCGESALAAEGEPVSSVGSGRPNAWRRGGACPACGRARGAEHRRSRATCCRGPLRAEPASLSAARLSLRQSPPPRTQPAP